MRQDFYIGVKGVFERDDHVLLIQEQTKAKWELPGGRVDRNEGTMFTAFAREIREEIPGTTNIELGRLLHTDIGQFVVENGRRLCLIFFEAKATFPETVELSSEHRDSRWAKESDLEDLDIFTTDREALEIYFTGRHTQDKKLVRDRIPEIISQNGGVPLTRLLGDAEFRSEIGRKMMEEAGEHAVAVTEEDRLGELADLEELILTDLERMGRTRHDLELVRVDKGVQRGGFSERIYLEGVTDGN